MVHLSGLRKRASYDDLINYINTDKTKIIYPNRRATFLANSPQISSLLELDVMDQQDQEIKKAKVAMSLGVKMEEPNTRTNVNNAGIPSTTNVSNNYYTSYNTGIPLHQHMLLITLTLAIIQVSPPRSLLELSIQDTYQIASPRG